MIDFFKKIFHIVVGHRVGRTRVVPVTLKITFIFLVIILVSNLTSNYINLVLNRSEVNSLLRQLLVKDLRELSNFSSTQFEIYEFVGEKETSLDAIEKKAAFELERGKGGLFLGVKRDHSILFQSAVRTEKISEFEDEAVLDKMFSGIGEGFLPVKLNGKKFLSVYKYNRQWDAVLILAVEKSKFDSEQRKNYILISIFIIFLAMISAAVGIYLIRNILQFMHVITENIMKMIKSQKLEIIPLENATNDDITYMGMAFNSLANTVDNMMGIFRKFTNKDIVARAYDEKQIGLEGVRKELTVLFTDIKGFTRITETLGMDIIKLLNLHYDRAIRKIHEHDGIISAIIGDALLAVFGVNLQDEKNYEIINKSYQSIHAAYKIQEVARNLRLEMNEKKDEVIRQKGKLTKEELKIYRAVLLEVGVGIDGGEVFYGTIGSHIRMTNTVIGDKVNSSSRMEGLTRIYRVPVICSEYVKNDIERNIQNHGIFFLELDTVQVKGKTIGTKIYFPVLEEHMTDRLVKEFKQFYNGLDNYYRGDWKRAYEFFKGLRYKPARVFRNRIRNTQPPEEWMGIWEMTTK